MAEITSSGQIKETFRPGVIAFHKRTGDCAEQARKTSCWSSLRLYSILEKISLQE